MTISKQIKDLVQRENRPQYIESIDVKHFSLESPGSTFVDLRAKKTEDVLEIAVEQRGDLFGDDREDLIKNGADPQAFLPKESNVRYLKVNISGVQAIKDTSSLQESEILTVMAKGGADGKLPSLSFVLDSKEKEKTDFATIIIGPDTDEENNFIPNTEVLWTLHPGVPTLGVRSEEIREKGLNDGSNLTVKEFTQLFKREIKVNLKN